jgi:hypothetical protein
LSVSAVNSPSIADWVTAFGTIGAVGVALFVAFLNNLLERYRRPILKIEFENKIPFCRHTPIGDEGRDGYFLRLRIRNVGKSMARDCEGKVVRILDAATRQERKDFDPTNLHWAGHHLSRKIVSIHRTAYEYLDVIWVQKDDPVIYTYPVQEESTGTPTAFTREEARMLILDIVLFGTNTKPVEKLFKVRTDGDDWDKVSLEETT